MVAKKFKCESCNKSFRSERDFQAHLRLSLAHLTGTQAPKTPEKRQEEDVIDVQPITIQETLDTIEKEVLEQKPDATNEALFFIWDLLDRSQVKFILLKDVAKQIKESESKIVPDLHVKTIDLGVQKRHLHEVATSMLKGLFHLYKVEPEWNESFIRFNHKGVPIFIRIIQRNYEFFQNPNPVFYRTENFSVPNPFDDYWIARFIIK